MNVLIYGSAGYVGSAIAKECDRRGVGWYQGNRSSIEILRKEFDAVMPDIVINAAAFVPQPTVDACKDHMDDTILGNVVWPSKLAAVCSECRVPLAHLSTACLFDEQRDYTEQDEPTRGWTGYCGSYVATKKISERVVREYEKHYILRLRLPFDEVDHPRNYLSKLASFDRVFEHTNSLTHRGDFAKWALDLWEKKASWGTYNCCNVGQISAAQIITQMGLMGLLKKMPLMVKSEGTTGARLSVQKLISTGVHVRSVEEAVHEALQSWKCST